MTTGTKDGRVAAPDPRGASHPMAGGRRLLHAEYRYPGIAYALLILGFDLAPLVPAIAVAT